MRLISLAMALAMGLAAPAALATPAGDAQVQAGSTSPDTVPADDWGVLGQFVGKDLVCTCDPKRIMHVRWDESGNALRLVRQEEYGTSVNVFRRQTDGRGVADLYWAEIGEGGALVPLLKGEQVGGIDLTPAKFDVPWQVGADGSLVLDSGTERRPYRVRYRLAGDHLVLESTRGDAWKLVKEMREIGPDDVEAVRLSRALHPQVGAPSAARVPSPVGRVKRGEQVATVAASAPAGESGQSAIPVIGIGQEVAGDLSNGQRGKHGPNVPVAAYRFHGEKGQRVCARVVSPDAYMHVYLARSLESGTPPLYTSWLPDYTDGATPPPYRPEWRNLANKQPDGFSATLPASGEYVVYAMAHEARREFNEVQGFETLQYARERPATRGGSYELKLWDADQPEPASALPGQQERQHPHATGQIWLGDIGNLIGQPWIDEQKGVLYTYSVRDGALVHAARSIETNRPVYEWRLAPTGRRGQYRMAEKGVSLDVQCDGSWTISGPGSNHVHYRFNPDSGAGRPSVTMKKAAAPLFAYRRGAGKRAIFDYIGTMIEVTDDTLAYAAGAIERRQREEADYQAWQAELAAAESASMANAMGAFVQGMGDATRSNQAMQQSMEDARDRGLAEGALEYARRQAEQVRQEAAYSQADVEHARQVREAEEAARQLRLPESQAADARRAQAAQQASVSGGDVDGGQASTDDDAMTCVTSPVTRPLRYGKNAMEASVTNQCDRSVDIVLCLQNAEGWRCGVKMGVSPGAGMVHELDNADGQTFMDAKTMGSPRPLARP